MEKTCYDTTSPELFLHFLTYSSLVSVGMFALPFVAVAACYSLMARKLLEPGWGSPGEVAGEVGRESGGAAAQRSKRRAVKMIIIVLAAFILCFLPYHLTRSLHLVLKYVRQQRPGQVSCDVINATNLAYKITRLMASANSCLDPVLYFLAGQGFRGNLPKSCRVKSLEQLETIEPVNSQN